MTKVEALKWVKELASDDEHGAAEYAYEHAVKLADGRWPEAEEFIAGHAEWAYEYARGVIKGRWPEAEKAILEDPCFLVEYAIHVIKGRWLEGECALLNFDCESVDETYPYFRPLFQGPVAPCGTEHSCPREWAVSYVVNLTKARWPELELLLCKERCLNPRYYDMLISLYVNAVDWSHPQSDYPVPSVLVSMVNNSL